MTQINRTPTDFTSQSSEGRIRETGIFIGVVKDNVDAQKMGRLSVYIPEFGGNPDDPASWYTVSYASPFAGATNVDKNIDGSKDMGGSQTSYGLWMVPPDLENQVLCCFVMGDLTRGYWFACIWQQFMNHMVPGIPINVSTNDEFNKKNLPPVVEYNKKDKEQNVWNPKRPIFEPLSNGFSKQGLYADPERGPATTGARRETPSKVFGMLSPRGNTIHIDDDEDNEFIRLRTRSGVQLVIHETTGYIYMISKEGNSWLEISDEGIDMYSKRSISMRAEENINIHADQNVMVYSSGAYHTQAANITQKSDGRITTRAGGIIARNSPKIKDNSRPEGGSGAKTSTSASPGGSGAQNSPVSNPKASAAGDGSNSNSSATGGAPTPPADPNDRFAAAKSMLGKNERRDKGAISNYIKTNTGVSVDPSSTAWCGYFTGASLRAAGYNSLPASQMGNSQAWRNYGTAVNGKPQIGDVAVYNNGWRHVGVVTGFAPNGNPIVTSGNSSDSVKNDSSRPASAYTMRRPTSELPNQPGMVGNQGDAGGGAAGGEGGANAAPADDRQGTGTGNTDTASSNADTARSVAPPQAVAKDDITGSAGNYQKTTTSSAVSRLPTHEPWDGHPKSKKPARSGLGDTDTGDTTDQGGGGGSTGVGKGERTPQDGTGSGSTSTSSPVYHDTTANNSDILNTIKQRESRGDYTVRSTSSTASGAYQFTDGTWKDRARLAGVGTEYPRAYMAPPAVQDAVANHYVSDILKKNNNDVSKVPLVWYTGNAQGVMSAKALAANRGLTAEQYQSKWMKDYAKTKKKPETGDKGMAPPDATDSAATGASAGGAAPSTGTPKAESGISVSPNTGFASPSARD